MSARKLVLATLAFAIVTDALALTASAAAIGPARGNDPAPNPAAPHASAALWLPITVWCYPSITISAVPPYGVAGDARGSVAPCIDPADYRVAVYIRVGGGYWTKPYWSQPVTGVAADRSWCADISTGGIDELASEVLAFLIPAGYDPPLLYGASSLPAELYGRAHGYALAYRAAAATGSEPGPAAPGKSGPATAARR